MDMTKKCATCGAEYGESTRFCSRCGSNQFVPLMAAAPAAMKRCAQCGAECKPEARFCSTCGSGNFVAVAPIPVPAPTPAPAPAPTPRSKKPAILGAFLGAVALILVAVLLIGLLPGSDSGKRGSSSGGAGNDSHLQNPTDPTVPSTNHYPDYNPGGDENDQPGNTPGNDNPGNNNNNNSNLNENAGYYPGFNLTNAPGYAGYYTNADHQPASSSITKTVMIYIVGSNLETYNGAATTDLGEMELSHVDTDKTNVLVYTGGAAQWQNTVLSSDHNSVLLLGENGFDVIATQNAVNMGKSETLAGFLDYCRKSYPADSYSLILWNHGGGPILGYGNDELYNYDCLSMTELQNGLRQGGFSSSNKLEFIGFDACLMSSIETAWCLKDYANYMVASQELEPGCGWDYAFLEILNTYHRGDAIGKEIIDYYFDKLSTYGGDLTLSCLNLTKINAVAQAMSNLFSQVDTDIAAGAFANVSRCRYNSKSFAKSSSGEYDLVDLRHLTTLLSAYYPNEAQALITALDQFVVYNRANTNNANGVSVYHPYDDRTYLSDCLEIYDTFDFSDSYTKYITNFAEMLTGGSIGDWDSYRDAPVTVAPQGNDYTISMNLSQDQLANYAGSAYFILYQTEMFGKTQYVPVFTGHDATLSSSGQLTASYQNKTIYANTIKQGGQNAMPIIMTQIWDGSGEEKYEAPATFWYMESLETLDIVVVDCIIKMIDGEPQLVSAIPFNPDAPDVPGKQELDYHDYTFIWFTTMARILTRDENGDILPFYEWELGDQLGTEVAVENGLKLEICDIQDPENYSAMFIVWDTQGNTYNSQLIPLAS